MYEIEYGKNKRNIINLAAENKDNDRIFCLLLYTDKNPYIKKCLRDEYFWDSLDDRSGELFNIYAVRPKAPKNKNNFTRNTGRTMNFMVDYWDKPSDNTDLISELALSDTKDLPLIYFLNKDFGDTFIVPIEGKNESEVYNDIENIIMKVSELNNLDKFTFEHLEAAFKRRGIWRGFKKFGKKYKFVSDILLSQLI